MTCICLGVKRISPDITKTMFCFVELFGGTIGGGDVFPIWRIVHIKTGNGSEFCNATIPHFKIPHMVHQKNHEVRFGSVISQYKEGNFGIRYLKSELINHSDYSNEMNINFIQDVFKQLNSYTGPVVTRSLFHQFLKTSGQGDEYEQLLSCAALLRDKWENIGFLLMKSVYSTDNQKLSKAYDQLECIMDLEANMQSLIAKSPPICLDTFMK